MAAALPEVYDSVQQRGVADVATPHCPMAEAAGVLSHVEQPPVLDTRSALATHLTEN